MATPSRLSPCYSLCVIQAARIRGFLWLASLLVFCTVACHKEQQAVVGVAQTAVNAEHKAQANATERDQQRDKIEQIPLPTKSLYVDIHDLSAWTNPVLVVGPDSITLRTLPPDAPNPVPTGKKTASRSEAARHQELQIQPADLAKSIVAIPAGAWRYGRVIAIAEAPISNKKDRPKVRRNVEDVLKQLNDLGIVVQEWPAR